MKETKVRWSPGGLTGLLEAPDPMRRDEAHGSSEAFTEGGLLFWSFL